MKKFFVEELCEEELCVEELWGTRSQFYDNTEKIYKYFGKCIKNNDKLLNARKSNAKYIFEFKNNLIQNIFTKKK
jgi:hypothetical protein